MDGLAMAARLLCPFLRFLLLHVVDRPAIVYLIDGCYVVDSGGQLMMMMMMILRSNTVVFVDVCNYAAVTLSALKPPHCDAVVDANGELLILVLDESLAVSQFLSFSLL